MSEDYYESDGGISDSKPSDQGPSEGDSKTFLLNKDVCPGMKPGDTGAFRVEREMEGEFECSYIDEKKEESAEQKPEPAMAPSDGMFD